MGHATRSAVVIEYLLQKGHDVEVITSDRAYTFLSERFPGRVHAIEGFHLAFEGSEISVRKTVTQVIRKAPQKLRTNWKQYFHFLKNKTFDYVISDFETYAAFYAKLHRVPLFSLDNIQVIDRAYPSISIPKEERTNYEIAKQVIRMKVPGAAHYLITSFIDLAIRKKNTTIIPSIIRSAVLELQPRYDKHVLIYQYATSEDQLIPILQTFPNITFYVFGFNKEADYGHVQLKRFSEDEFLQLFATAKAVMCHGGFSFISEAVYLHKPVFSVPIVNQFEQYFNAASIEKMGYGMHASQFDCSAIQRFFEKLNEYQMKLQQYMQDGNEVLFETLDRLLVKHSR